MPVVMRAVELRGFGGPEVLTPCERPRPVPAAGEVLIRVQAAGVNRPDVVQRQGKYPPPPGASDLPGLEVAGEVVALGKGVETPAIGERVCALLSGGGYAEFAVAPATQVLAVPAGTDMIQAAALPEAAFTVWNNLFMRAALKSGERLLVHGGASGIGTTAIQMAHARGVDVYTTVGTPEKATLCEALGARRAIRYHDEDFVEVIRECTDGQGVDVVLDMIGGDYLPRNLKCLAEDGRHVSIAFLHGARIELNFMPVMLRRLTLTGSTLRARSVAFKAEVATQLRREVWPMIEQGALAPVIDSVYPLASAAEAHRRMDSGAHAGKIVLTI